MTSSNGSLSLYSMILTFQKLKLSILGVVTEESEILAANLIYDGKDVWASDRGYGWVEAKRKIIYIA